MVLGLVVIVLSAGLLWFFMQVPRFFMFEASKTEVLQNQIDSLESRIAQLEEWLRGNLTYYSSQIENLTSQIENLRSQIGLLQEQTSTRYEKLEFTSAHVTATASSFNITIS